MALREPESMSEVIYYTRRELGDKGNVVVWVYKQKCPVCGKALMGKPTDKKGKVLIRAKEYVCPECKHTVEKKAYEETLTASAKYTCPKCGNKGEIEFPFKRKSIEGVQTLRFQCQKCGNNIDVTKKMKGLGDSSDDD